MRYLIDVVVPVTRERLSVVEEAPSAMLARALVTHKLRLTSTDVEVTRCEPVGVTLATSMRGW